MRGVAETGGSTCHGTFGNLRDPFTLKRLDQPTGQAEAAS